MLRRAVAGGTSALRGTPRTSLWGLQARHASKHLKAFATLDPARLTPATRGMNLVQGEWVGTESYKALVDPMTGSPMISLPDTSMDEIDPFVESLRAVPKHGLHNPLKNKERYLMLGQVCRKTTEVLYDPEVFEFFVQCVMRSIPKSRPQTEAELRVTRAFFENFSGDQVRFLAEGKQIPGDHLGQSNTGYRWPFGPVGVITPFNFPIEIAVLQFMGALFMGNKPFVKPDIRCSFPLEQWIRMLHYCGLPKEDMDFMHGDGPVGEKVLKKGKARMTLFTGSSRVGDHLVKALDGRVKLEDGGFDWKILGPGVPKSQAEVDYVAWQCDHDAYGHSGQKCSAQSMMFVHKNWRKTDVLDKMAAQAGKRNLENLTVGPVITWTTERIAAHVEACLQLEGAELLFGGVPLRNHTIPPVYGAYEPTAIKVPIKHFRSKKKRDLLCTELFGPFQIVVEWGDKDYGHLLDILESQPHHLTAAIVSNDPVFNDAVLGHTVNGTQYSGLKARTTGAPQNHWFGPCGDPRGAGIGTPYAITYTWSHHREIVTDIGPVPSDWQTPPPA